VKGLVDRGQAVVIELDRYGRFTGRVEAAAGERLAIAALARLPVAPAELAGTAARVAVTTPRGIVRSLAVVMGADRSGLVEVEIVDELQVDQRREHVRVGLRLPGAVGPRDTSVGLLDTYTLDVSGGGVLVAGAGPADAGDPVAVLVKLPGSDPLHAEGRVARRSAAGHAAVAFERLDEQARELLVRMVFEQQRLERRAALEER
jgi:hypothetical protein